MSCTVPRPGGDGRPDPDRPGSTIPAHRHSLADETVYVLEGDFIEAGVGYGLGAFFAGKAGTPHGPHSS